MATLFIWVFGFALGNIVHSVLSNTDPDIALKYNLRSYPLNKPFPGYSLSWYFLIVLFFFIIYLLMKRFKSNQIMQKYAILIVIPIYFVYGIFVFGGQLWKLSFLFGEKFILWLAAEHSDHYFSISSLLAVILFTILLKRNYKISPGSQKVLTS
jgi:hypothetical protein